MSKGTVSWFKSLVKLSKVALQQVSSGQSVTYSRMQLQLPYTWSANKFTTFWKQRFSFFIAQDRAIKANILIGKSQPKADRGWMEGG